MSVWEVSGFVDRFNRILPSNNIEINLCSEWIITEILMCRKSNLLNLNIYGLFCHTPLPHAETWKWQAEGPMQTKSHRPKLEFEDLFLACWLHPWCSKQIRGINIVRPFIFYYLVYGFLCRKCWMGGGKKKIQNSIRPSEDLLKFNALPETSV